MIIWISKERNVAISVDSIAKSDLNRNKKRAVVKHWQYKRERWIASKCECTIAIDGLYESCVYSTYTKHAWPWNGPVRVCICICIGVIVTLRFICSFAVYRSMLFCIKVLLFGSNVVTKRQVRISNIVALICLCLRHFLSALSYCSRREL